MAFVDFDIFKAHVRSDDFAEDDAYLRHLLRTAESYVLRSVNRTADELVDSETGALPPQLIHAAMLIGAHWYNQRETVGSAQYAEVPYTLQALLKPFRRLV